MFEQLKLMAGLRERVEPHLWSLPMFAEIRPEVHAAVNA